MKKMNMVLLSAAFCILTFTVVKGEEIINGQKAKKNTLQFMVSVQKNELHGCGGFLIHSSFVLSAAHCYDADSVVVGTHNLVPMWSNVKRYAVKKLQMHPSYQINKTGLGYDIMILKLEKNVELNKDVQIIKIPAKNHQVKPNTTCQVAGWGETEKAAMSIDLMVTDVSTIDYTTCENTWGKLPPNVLCARGFPPVKGFCKGDSGGPLVCGDEAVGIVSFYRNNCTSANVMNIYTEIAPYADWINDMINKLNA